MLTILYLIHQIHTTYKLTYNIEHYKLKFSFTMYYASSYELNQYKHIKYILNEKFTSNSLHEKHRMVVYLHRINIKIIFKLLNRLTIFFKQRNVRYIKEYRQYLLNKLTKYALIIAILFSLFIYGNFFYQ